MSAAVEISDLSFAHSSAAIPALASVSLAAGSGETLALLGPSGAGKTTLLTLLDGRLRGWCGRVAVLGAALSPDRAPPRRDRADTGFVFQEFALVERSSVWRNVLNGRLGRMGAARALLSRPGAYDAGIVHRALDDCGIADLADRRVDTLSGGQRQRVAIARCLAQEPKLILADEPVSNLDPARAAEILGLLTEAGRLRGATTVFSSHQPELARRFADRVVGMRNGRVLFDLPAEALTEGDEAALYRDDDPAPAARLQVVR